MRAEGPPWRLDWTSQHVISKPRAPSPRAEHEVGGEALAVSLNRLVENARLHAVERGEVGIEQDLVAAYEEDVAPDALDRDDGTPCSRLLGPP